MTKDYQMITLKAFLDELDNGKTQSWEKEITNKFEREYLKLAANRKDKAVVNI